MQKQYEEGFSLFQILNWLMNIVCVMAGTLFLLMMLGSTMEMTGKSMLPTLQEGDRLLVNKMIYQLISPGRMDVVVIEKDGRGLVKRIVGLPGDTISMENGEIYVNGSKLELSVEYSSSNAGLTMEPILLLSNEYFVLGDNADYSEDSRFSYFGTVSREELVGKVWFRFQSLQDWGQVHE